MNIVWKGVGYVKNLSVHPGNQHVCPWSECSQVGRPAHGKFIFILGRHTQKCYHSRSPHKSYRRESLHSQLIFTLKWHPGNLNSSSVQNLRCRVTPSHISLGLQTLWNDLKAEESSKPHAWHRSTRTVPGLEVTVRVLNFIDVNQMWIGFLAISEVGKECLNALSSFWLLGGSWQAGQELPCRVQGRALTGPMMMQMIWFCIMKKKSIGDGSPCFHRGRSRGQL